MALTTTNSATAESISQGRAVGDVVRRLNRASSERNRSTKPPAEDEAEPDGSLTSALASACSSSATADMVPAVSPHAVAVRASGGCGRERAAELLDWRRPAPLCAARRVEERDPDACRPRRARARPWRTFRGTCRRGRGRQTALSRGDLAEAYARARVCGRARSAGPGSPRPHVHPHPVVLE